MRREVDYLPPSDLGIAENWPWVAAGLVAFNWLGSILKKVFNALTFPIRESAKWFWKRIKSIFSRYPVIEKDLADIKTTIGAIETKIVIIEQRQFESQKTWGRVEAFLEQTEPLYKKINAYFAKYDAPRE
jgi:hypothetical protein